MATYAWDRKTRPVILPGTVSHIARCPMIWTARISRRFKAQYHTYEPDTFVFGFDGATRAEVQGRIADAVANGEWPKNTLQPIFVSDCRRK